jgi:EmrB/QacA subfamily drug resistance transporter
LCHTAGMTRTQRWTLIAAIIGSGVVFLDGTIVNLALRAIGKLPTTFLGVLEGQNYIVSGYLAVLSALLILSGALADFYGRRKIFAIGLTGFGISSLLCGIAPNLELLVLFRLVQGAAGALLVPGSLSIITATFEGQARARAFGTWAAATSALTLFGQPVGGLLVDLLSWRVAFIINVPLVAIALWATIRHMQESRDETATGAFDWLGAAVGAIAIGGLAFGATRGQQEKWQDPLAWAALIVGAVALVIFPILMRRPHPLVPLSLFRIRDFAVINLSTFLIYAALYVTQFYNSVLLQATLGYTATAAALTGLPSGILLVVLSTRVGTVAGRIGAKPFLVIGPLIMALGMLWWARIPPGSEPWKASFENLSTLIPPASVFIDVLPALITFGLGISLVVAPLTSTLMGSIPSRNAGLGSAINNAVSRVGTPLLGAVLFIVVSATFYSSLGSQVAGLNTDDPAVRTTFPPLNQPTEQVPPDQLEAAKVASVDAFHVAAIASIVLLVGGAGANYFGLRGAAAGAREEEKSASTDSTAEPAAPAA